MNSSKISGGAWIMANKVLSDPAILTLALMVFSWTLYLVRDQFTYFFFRFPLDDTSFPRFLSNLLAAKGFVLLVSISLSYLFSDGLWWNTYIKPSNLRLMLLFSFFLVVGCFLDLLPKKFEYRARNSKSGMVNSKVLRWVLFLGKYSFIPVYSLLGIIIVSRGFDRSVVGALFLVLFSLFFESVKVNSNTLNMIIDSKNTEFFLIFKAENFDLHHLDCNIYKTRSGNYGIFGLVLTCREHMYLLMVNHIHVSVPIDSVYSITEGCAVNVESVEIYKSI